MKKRNIILPTLLVALSAVAFVGCGTDPVIGLPSSDDTAPATPKVTEVVNTSGAATIYYDVPTDKDLMYVVATYNNNANSTRTIKASAYQNSLAVEGFGTAGDYVVTLKSVDKSRNESSPVTVTVSPTTPPVELIFESLNATAGWGGIKLTWDNPTEANVIVSTLKWNEDDKEWVSLDNMYSSTAEGTGSIRNLESVEQRFKIYVRDRFDNFSAEKEFVLTPWYEQQLDKAKFKEVTPLPGDCLINGSFPIRNIWDGVSTGDSILHGTQGNGGGIGRFVTFDMGQLAKLSRYRLFHRTNSSSFYYAHNNLKHWVMYGATEITDAMRQKTDVSVDVLGGRYNDTEAEYNAWVVDQTEGWILLDEAECYRPSGLQTPGGASTSQEDLAYILAGDEHEIDIDKPVIRYIRMLCVSNWSGGIIPQFSEITFWGAVEE